MSKVICIDGCMGVGKTTTITNLANFMVSPYYHEKVDENEYLEPYYKGDYSITYKLQERALELAISNIDVALVNDAEYSLVDVSPMFTVMVYAKLAFINGYITSNEYKYLKDEVEVQGTRVKAVYILMASPSTIMQRVTQRNRQMETTVQLPYIQSLCQLVDEYKYSGVVDWMVTIDASQPSAKVYRDIARHIYYVNN